jgi:hypothetical protein
MSQYREYQGKVTGQSSCSYSRLKDVSTPYFPPSLRTGESSSMYNVPQFCPTGSAPNYPPQPDTLSHNQPYLCGGYFSMKSAYPSATCSECKAHYVKRPCTGNITCNSSVEPYCKVIKESYCGSCGVEGYHPPPY